MQLTYSKLTEKIDNVIRRTIEFFEINKIYLSILRNKTNILCIGVII